MQTLPKTTANSWDSFKDALYAVLNAIKPQNILEYGPGSSSKIMGLFPSVKMIDSVEDNMAWYSKYRWEVPDTVKIYYQPNLDMYPQTPGRVDKYDLIFVDGKKREECLYLAKERLVEGGVVVLHDAERPNYQEPISFYKYKFFQDGGHTCILTDNNVTAMRIGSAFNED